MTMISMNAMTLMKVITNTHVEIGKLQALIMHFAITIVISLEKKNLFQLSHLLLLLLLLRQADI